MRVLHVTPFYPPAPSRGGMARASGELCRALAALGHEVTVFTTSTAPLAGEERRHGVRIRRFPGPRWPAARLVPFARGIDDAILADGGAFDIAHLHGLRSGIVRQAAAALRRVGLPWVLQPHGTFPHHGQQRLAKVVWDALGGMEAVRRARALLALSDAEARDLPAPAIVIGSGVALPGTATGTVRAPATSPRLLFVGSDAPQKRGHMLVDLLRALPEAHLDLVGPMRPRFVGAFDGFAGRTAVHGVLEDDALLERLVANDLLIHPAVGEAFGMIPFEAALAGTGAVVAGGHGCGEWFGRAGGCVVPPDDHESLVREVRRRIADPSLARAEAGAVASFVRRELTWPQIAARVASVYDTVAAPATTPPRAVRAG